MRIVRLSLSALVILLLVGAIWPRRPGGDPPGDYCPGGELFCSDFNETGCAADGFSEEAGSPDCDSTFFSIDGESFQVAGQTAHVIRTAAMVSVGDIICITYYLALNTNPGGSEKSIRAVDSGDAYTFPDVGASSTQRVTIYCDADSSENSSSSLDWDPLTRSYYKIEVQFTRSTGAMELWIDDSSEATLAAGVCDDSPNVVEHFELNDPGTGGNLSRDDFKVENGACS